MAGISFFAYKQPSRIGAAKRKARAMPDPTKQVFIVLPADSD
jgi:hypothetical protein